MIGTKNFLKALYRRLFGKLYADMDAKVRRLEDKMLILQSGLWDESYYVREADWRRRGDDAPLDHYLNEGWKKGFNPSEKFDGNAILKSKPDLQINPLVYFLRYGRYPLGNAFRASEETVREYLKAKSCRKTPVKKVVYSCITNGYDDLNELRAFYFTHPDWDYVCFTDDESMIRQKTLGIWEIRPLCFTEMDVVRNARRHKIQPHKLFPEYDESLYVDANVNILTPYVFQEIERRKKDLLVSAHTSRKCLYEEFQFVTSGGLIDPELGAKQIQAYRDAGFPENYGLHETNVLYRRHHEPEVKAIMEEWLYWIENFTQRDQLSLSFVLWKHGRSVNACSIHNARVENPDFCVFAHTGKFRNKTKD